MDAWSAPASRHSLHTVQAARAVAAVAVTAFHLSLMMGEPRYGGVPALEDWTALGKMGVDFFFVLSGFIILHAHASDIGQPGHVGRYLWRRFVRVYPVYWLYLAGYLGLLAIGVGREATLPAGADDWASAISLLRLSSADMPLYVAWTLFHEVAFYLAFATLILHRSVGVMVMVAWAASCLLAFQYPGEHPPGAFVTYTSLANLNFLIGMGAWWLLQRGWTHGSLVGLGVLLLVGIPLADGLKSESGPLTMGLGFGALLAGLCGLEMHRRWPRWLRWPQAWLAVGDASYSLYLLHLPLSGLLLKAVTPGPTLSPQGTFALVLTATVALSWMAYVALERPLVNGLQGRGPTRGSSAQKREVSWMPAKKNAHRKVGV